MNKIFIVNGRLTSGKTSFETMVKNIAAKNNKEVVILSTIDYIKEIATYIGWDGIKDASSRRMLSDLKDTLTRWNDVPYRKICEKISNIDNSVIFIDCREPEEIERFVLDFNAMTILVQRGEMVLIGNHADDNVMNYQYDITIDNSRGLAELEEEARIFYETFIENEN